MRQLHPRRAPLAALALALAACAPSLNNAPLKPTARAAEPAAVSAEAALWADEAFRDAQPQPGPIAEFSPPELAPYTLSNGVTVYAVSSAPLPTVSLSLSFDVGAVAEPAAKLGVTSLCLDLLDEGTRALDRAAFEARQADHAVSVWSSAGDDTASVNLRSLDNSFDDAFALMAEMMLEPGLRRADLERLRAQRKADLEQSRGSPSAISRRLFPALLWGPEHPRGRLVTEKTLDAVRLSDCRRIARRLTPKGARLYLSGDPDQAALELAFQTHMPRWGGEPPSVPVVPPPAPRVGAIYLVDAPGAAQSVITLGAPGPARSAEDYTATAVMARILGGSFSSRINMNLREDKGFAYGGRASFSYSREGGYLHAGASVRTDATADALRELAAELAGIHTRPPTEVELSRERDGALLALPARFATASSTLSAVRGLAFHGLPLDWYEGHQRALRRLDTDALAAAASAHVPRSDYVILVVGDAAVVRPGLEALAREGLLGARAVVELDADGQPPTPDATSETSPAKIPSRLPAKSTAKPTAKPTSSDSRPSTSQDDEPED
ncbi:MAG: insulinase family protein [Myxococcales bacterium]|nr:insulinase family protein [Myxococcales bacterium]